MYFLSRSATSSDRNMSSPQYVLTAVSAWHNDKNMVDAAILQQVISRGV